MSWKTATARRKRRGVSRSAAAGVGSSPWRREAGGVGRRDGVRGGAGRRVGQGGRCRSRRAVGGGDGVQPGGDGVGEAGGGGEEGVRRELGELEQGGGEGVDGGFAEQDAVGRSVGAGSMGGDPETAALFAGARGEALEGGAGGAGAGVVEFGAGGLLLEVAAEEDGVLAGVGPQDAGLAALVEQAGVEASGAGQVVADGRPAGVAGGRQGERPVGAGLGWRSVCRGGGQGVEEGEDLRHILLYHRGMIRRGHHRMRSRSAVRAIRWRARRCRSSACAMSVRAA